MIKPLAGLAATAAIGLAILALPVEREDPAEGGIRVVRGQRVALAAVVPVAAPVPAMVGEARRDQHRWGPPGIWATPAEFAPPE